jgi:hypothetical protein
LRFWLSIRDFFANNTPDMPGFAISKRKNTTASDHLTAHILKITENSKKSVTGW